MHVPNPEDVLGAIHLQQHHRLSFWDAMILWSANQLDCDVVWSEDFNHGQVYDRVMVKNPSSPELQSSPDRELGQALVNYG